MQAAINHGRTLHCVVIVGVALTIITTATIAAVLVSQSDSQSGTAALIPGSSHPYPNVAQAADTRTFEQNTELPTGGRARSASGWSHETHRFWHSEREETPLAVGVPQSAGEIYYIEQNAWLPGSAEQPSSVWPTTDR